MKIINPLKITDTTLRDAHQSLWATRMKTDDMLAIADRLDKVGYHAIEAWGGATFDVCMRYLHEDPWERLSLLKRYIKKTPLQMLLRGQNLVGYQHYPDDVVEAFVEKAFDNGVQIFRIFDALNDVRNLETAMRAAKRVGAHVQAAVVYTVSPVHTIDHYSETAKKLVEFGADSICIKDMAGLLMPYVAYDLITRLKKETGLPIYLHSHYAGGMAIATYIKASEAGVDGVDTAAAPLAFGSSQAPVETIVRMFQGSERETGLLLPELFEISRYFDGVRKKYGYEYPVTRISDMRVFDHQVPGGMISNLVRQLEQQNALGRLHEVLEEIPRVRAEMGYPPLVTPTSQIVGTQAVLNVLMGERYKMIPSEVKAYVKGLYGRPPGEIDAKLSKLALGNDKAIQGRPADLLEPKLDKLRAEIKDITRNEEDILSYAMFPQVALKFFETRVRRAHEREMEMLLASEDLKPQKEGKSDAEAAENEEDEGMNLKDLQEVLRLMRDAGVSELNIDDGSVKLSISKGGSLQVSEAVTVPCCTDEAAVIMAADMQASAPGVAGGAVQVDRLKQVCSPMVGTFYASGSPDVAPYVKEGDKVTEGQALCIIEAMKLMNEVTADYDAKIVQVLVENGDAVEFGQPLFIIERV